MYFKNLSITDFVKKLNLSSVLSLLLSLRVFHLMELFSGTVRLKQSRIDEVAVSMQGLVKSDTVKEKEMFAVLCVYVLVW